MRKRKERRTGEKEKRLDLLSWVFWAVMLILQVRLIIVFKGEQFGDFMEYVGKAGEIAAAGAFYPRVSDLYGVPYLHAPGYVNFLSLIFRVTGDLRVVYAFNILFLQILLFSAKQIVRRLTDSRRQAAVFQILYCAYFSLGMGGGVVLANTEMLFCALVFLGMALVMTEKRTMLKLIAAGVCLGLANWIRPVALVFVPAVIFSICVPPKAADFPNREPGGKKKGISDTLVYLAAMLLTVICIGGCSYLSCGKFVYQSTTMGVNLLVGNSPVADGNNHWDVFFDGNAGDVSAEASSDWTFEEYENYYFETALKWMKENPLGVIKLIPARMFYLYAEDTYFATAYADNTIQTDTADYLKQIVVKLCKFQFGSLSSLDWLVILTEVYYLFILLLTVIGLIRQIGGKRWFRWLGLYSIVVLGTGMLMFMFGYGRFHFPYMIVFLMVAQSAFAERKRAAV